jgi:hypothetical protein
LQATDDSGRPLQGQQAHFLGLPSYQKSLAI